MAASLRLCLFFRFSVKQCVNATQLSSLVKKLLDMKLHNFFVFACKSDFPIIFVLLYSCLDVMNISNTPLICSKTPLEIS